MTSRGSHQVCVVGGEQDETRLRGQTATGIDGYCADTRSISLSAMEGWCVRRARIIGLRNSLLWTTGSPVHTEVDEIYLSPYQRQEVECSVRLIGLLPATSPSAVR
jgi:hypothetical protein